MPHNGGLHEGDQFEQELGRRLVKTAYYEAALMFH